MLINPEFHAELLKDTPYLTYHDLALICVYFQIEGNSLTRIHFLSKKQLAAWHITDETLFKIAKENTPRIMQERITPVRDAIEGEDLCAKDPFLIHPIIKDLYVLTNQYHRAGAVCIYFSEILEKFADEKDSDLIIIPSSIHEVLILPDSGHSPDDINDIIREVNETLVKPEDRLSNHCYYYRRGAGLVLY